VAASNHFLCFENCIPFTLKNKIVWSYTKSRVRQKMNVAKMNQVEGMVFIFSIIIFQGFAIFFIMQKSISISFLK
jgi:hypothetical protein